MIMILQRSPSADGATIGEITIGGEHQCYTCEDMVRHGPKVPGETAIPAGRYRVIVNMSNRFQRLLPLLVDVPGFEGVRIHPGNTAADTSGCLLPGLTRGANSVGQSRMAFEPLFAKIGAAVQDGGECWIEVRDAA